MTILLLLARLFLGAVFLMSAVPKLASPRQFARDVEGYGILRGPPATAFAWALPFVEMSDEGLTTGRSECQRHPGARANNALNALRILLAGE